jgi:hypothetical protein
MRSREAALVKRALIVLALSRLPVVLLANGPDPANADLNHGGDVANQLRGGRMKRVLRFISRVLQIRQAPTELFDREQVWARVAAARKR